MAVKPIPDGYYTATPYLIVRGAARAIDFYKEAFGAVELMRFPMPDGKLGHAEIKIGNSPIMLADESPEMGHKSPDTLGGSPVGIMLYVNDADKIFAQAIKAGAKTVMPLQDKFYGDRTGTVSDPFGHVWTVSTHKEDVPMDELQARMKKEMAEKS